MVTKAIQNVWAQIDNVYTINLANMDDLLTFEDDYMEVGTILLKILLGVHSG